MFQGSPILRLLHHEYILIHSNTVILQNLSSTFLFQQKWMYTHTFTQTRSRGSQKEGRSVETSGNFMWQMQKSWVVSRIEMFTNSTRKTDRYKEPKKNVQQRRKAFDGHCTQAPTPGQNTCNSPELWIPVIDQCRSLNHVELQSGSLLCAKTEDIWV